MTHDVSSAAFLPLKLLHILGAVLFLGGLATALYWKVSADRTNDSSHIARVHKRILLADKHLVGTGAFVTFAAGYAMVRFLGGKIGEHGFVLWGLILMFSALALWFFPMRRMGARLADEADACFLGKKPLSREFASKSVAWLTLGFLATSLVVVVAAMMVFHIPA